MFVVTLLPFATKMFGLLYLLGAVVLGIGFLYWAVILVINKNPDAPMETFKYSIIYLMALFVIMIVDHYVYPLDTRIAPEQPAMELQIAPEKLQGYVPLSKAE